MATATAHKQSARIRDLLRLLGDMTSMHVELEQAIKRKLGAIRDGDAQATHAAGQIEQDLAQRIREREGLRKQLMDAIGIELGMGPGEGRRLTVSELSGRAPQEWRAGMEQSVGNLRKAMAGAAQANRVAGATLRTLLHHMQWVLTAIRPSGPAPMTYSDKGKMVTQGGTVALETTG